MASYQWNPAAFGKILALPAAVAEQHLKLAGPLQLKVLLWFASQNGAFALSSCAAACGYSEADCADALRYWVSAGLLCEDGAPIAAAPAPAPSLPAAAVSPSLPPSPTPRPRAVKPQMKEVVATQKRSPQFAYLLDTVSARLGKPLTYGDMETLLYLHDTAALPVEIILMVVEYAAQSDRFSMRYIEKIALDWADKGITTLTAAEEHLCYLERGREALAKVQTVCALPRPLSAAATTMALAEKWVFTWQVADDLLRYAYTVCLDSKGGFHAKYIDRVLENWRSQGIVSAEAAAALSASPKKAAKPAEEPSEYEQMVEHYLPVYKKKKKG
ncbi:MAG: DnaD domain protein [Clostridia bacterium]|nr:DnaD domain protein [Clostridia bacterium]